MIAPDTFRKKLMLRLARPIVVLLGMPQMQTLNLLQENNIRVQRTQTVAQLMHHHAPVELRKAFMNIPRGNGQHD
jgi:hypothetical protein